MVRSPVPLKFTAVGEFKPSVENPEVSANCQVVPKAAAHDIKANEAAAQELRCGKPNRVDIDLSQ